MANEIRWCLERRLPGEIIGRRAQHPPVGGEATCNHVRVLELCHADQKVDLFVKKIIKTIARDQSQLNLGVAFCELRRKRCKMQPGKCHWRRHLERTRWLIPVQGHCALCLIHRFEDFQAVLQEGVPVRRHVYLAGGAVQKSQAEFFFEAHQARANHGRRQPQVAASRGQTAKFRHPHKQHQVIGIHLFSKKTIKCFRIVMISLKTGQY